MIKISRSKKMKNLFDDGEIKRYIYYRPVKKYNEYECILCMKWYKKKEEAINCCSKLKPEWLQFLKKGKYKKYNKNSIGFMCLTCKSYFLNNCKCHYGKFNDDCEQCW